MSRTKLSYLSRVHSICFGAAYIKAAPLQRPHSRQGLHKLALSVSFNCRYTQHLSCLYFKRYAVYSQKSSVIGNVDIVSLYHDFPRLSCSFYMVKKYFSSHHHGGENTLVYILRLFNSHQFAAAHYRHPVGDAHYLVKLMGDDDDRHLLFLYDFSYNREQFLCFLRRKHCRRLVQNEDVRAAIKCFEYFHSLLQTNAYFSHLGFRLHLKTVFFHQPFRFAVCSFKVIQYAQLAGFFAHYYVLSHRKGRYQHEMLMHHSYAHAYGFFRVEFFNPSAVYVYSSVRRLMNTVKDIHKGTLSCPVLADQRKNLSLFYVKGNPVVCQNPGKLHRNIFKSYY